MAALVQHLENTVANGLAPVIGKLASARGAWGGVPGRRVGVPCTVGVGGCTRM